MPEEITPPIIQNGNGESQKPQIYPDVLPSTTNDPVQSAQHILEDAFQIKKRDGSHSDDSGGMQVSIPDPKSTLEQIAKGDFSQSQEKNENLAEVTGTFYLRMLQTFLHEGITPDERGQELSQLLDTLPERIKIIYKRISDRTQEQLTANKTKQNSQ